MRSHHHAEIRRDNLRWLMFQKNAMKRKKINLGKLSAEHLEFKVRSLNRDAEYSRSQILDHSELETLAEELRKIKVLSSAIADEIGNLRDDPKNIVKTGFFGWGEQRWTDECERKVTALFEKGANFEQGEKSIKKRLFDHEAYSQSLERTIKKCGPYLRELKKRETTKKKKLKHEELKVRAKRNEDEIRKMAQGVRRALFEDGARCPYCYKALGADPHADHIYPVSKGGLSVVENMVMVCSSCNLKKTNLTLREFIGKYRLDREEIERRLDELGKRF